MEKLHHGLIFHLWSENSTGNITSWVNLYISALKTALEILHLGLICISLLWKQHWKYFTTELAITFRFELRRWIVSPLISLFFKLNINRMIYNNKWSKSEINIFPPSLYVVGYQCQQELGFLQWSPQVVGHHNCPTYKRCSKAAPRLVSNEWDLKQELFVPRDVCGNTPRVLPEGGWLREYSWTMYRIP